MQADVEDEQAPSANTVLAGDIEQPGWVNALQASLQNGLDSMQAKIDRGQHSMDAKLDLIGKHMEDNLKGVRENVGQLREHMDKLGEEMKQGLDSVREDTTRKFETVDVDMRAQKKDIEMLEERTVDVEEWSTEIQDILKALLEQQNKLREK
ncbi:hypothetical protein JOB18_012826, partial [Solea senegalensis]